MSVFGKILSKLGIKKKEEKEEKVAEVKKPVKKSPVTEKRSSKPVKRYSERVKKSAQPSIKSPLDAAAKTASGPVIVAKADVAAMEMVDVMGKLESMGKGSGLKWKKSIVDLLKVLGIDSSLSSRKELAKELACPEELMGDSAKMNTWLHKTVLQQIAKNGGNVPQNLLD